MVLRKWGLRDAGAQGVDGYCMLNVSLSREGGLVFKHMGIMSDRKPTYELTGGEVLKEEVWENEEVWFTEVCVLPIGEGSMRIEPFKEVVRWFDVEGRDFKVVDFDGVFGGFENGRVVEYLTEEEERILDEKEDLEMRGKELLRRVVSVLMDVGWKEDASKEFARSLYMKYVTGESVEYPKEAGDLGLGDLISDYWQTLMDASDLGKGGFNGH